MRETGPRFVRRLVGPRFADRRGPAFCGAFVFAAGEKGKEGAARGKNFPVRGKRRAIVLTAVKFSCIVA